MWFKFNLGFKTLLLQCALAANYSRYVGWIRIFFSLVWRTISQRSLKASRFQAFILGGFPQPWRSTYLSARPIFFSRLDLLSWRNEGKSKSRWEKGFRRPRQSPHRRFSHVLILFQGKGSHKTYWLLNRRGFNPCVGTHGAPQTGNQKLLPEVHQGPFCEAPTAYRLSHAF